MDDARVIFHVDMDAFFASVEQRDGPSLRGRPVLVGGTGRRGVVAAASYEARRFGCHSAQPMAVATRLCPHAAIVPPRGRVYHAVSKQVFAIFDRYTPVVQPLSVDEAFLDMSGTQRLHGPARSVAVQLKQEIRDEVDLAASIGVAPNKFLAKLASDLDKPDGLVVVDDRWIELELPRMPIGRMWGVGPATEQRLRAVGIETFADLQRRPASELRQSLGSDAVRLRALARGEDTRRVVPHGKARSISHEQTFGTDRERPEEVRRIMLSQAERVAERLRKHRLRARCVSVKIRYGNFETITRATTLQTPTDRTDLIWNAARGLFDRWAAEAFKPVRLIGVAASHLSDDGDQLELFTREADDRTRDLDRTTDEIRSKFGAGAIRRGG